MGRNRFSVADPVRAVSLLKSRSSVTVQLVVERANLIPQTRQLSLEQVRSHVVTRFPKVAQVGKPELACAAVG